MKNKQQFETRFQPDGGAPIDNNNSSPKPSEQATARRSFLASLPALGLLLLPSFALADPSSDLLAAILRARLRLHSLDAIFTQERNLSLLDTSITSKGRLRLSGADRLRWDIDPPDEITYWISRGLVSYRSASSKGQVIKRNAGTMGLVLDDLLIALGGDLRRLSSRHRVSCERKDGHVLVQIRPLDPNAQHAFRQIELSLAPDLLTPQQISIEESASDRIRIHFDSVSINVAIDPVDLNPPS